MSIGYLDAVKLQGRTVELTMTDWIRERKNLPCCTVLARLERPSNLASGLSGVLDGETGEILSFDGEMIWIPYSQTESLVEAGAAPDDDPEGTPYGMEEFEQRGAMLRPEPIPDFILEQLGFTSRDDYDAWEREEERVYREQTAVYDPTEAVVLPEPVPAADTLEVDPLDPGDSKPKPYEAWAQCGVVEIEQHGADIRLLLNNDDLPRVLDLTAEEVRDLAYACFLVTITLDARGDSAMPITVAELERVRAVMKRLQAAADAAINDLEADHRAYKQKGGKATLGQHTLIMGSPNTAAVRRASMDLTRALAELRSRP